MKELKDAGTRDGFLIHGGDAAAVGGSWYPLRPTLGCIRITNADQLVLETEIEEMMDNYHYVIGNISITEVAS